MKYIVVHHTAVSYDRNPDQFNQTNQFHKDKWNMKSTLGFYGGYNFEISKTGTIRQFREIGEETVAATGHNFDSIHICLDGNFDIELPTEAQKKSLKSLLEKYVLEYGIERSCIVPHRHFKDVLKSCFGSKLKDTWAQELLTPSPVNEGDIIKLQLSLIEKLKLLLANLLTWKN